MAENFRAARRRSRSARSGPTALFADSKDTGLGMQSALSAGPAGKTAGKASAKASSKAGKPAGGSSNAEVMIVRSEDAQATDDAEDGLREQEYGSYFITFVCSALPAAHCVSEVFITKPADIRWICSARHHVPQDCVQWQLAAGPAKAPATT